MRSFKQQADRIVELISYKVHPATVEELLPLLKEASNQYHQENLGPTPRCFEVDIQDEFVDFAFWNPDLLCGESSSFVRGRKHKDKVSDDRLLDWISRSIRRLAEVELQWYQLSVWYQFKRDSLYPSDSKLSRDKDKWSETGLRRIRQGVYAVRHDAISQYVKRDLRKESTFEVYRG